MSAGPWRKNRTQEDIDLSNKLTREKGKLKARDRRKSRTKDQVEKDLVYSRNKWKEKGKAYSSNYLNRVSPEKKEKLRVSRKDKMEKYHSRLKSSGGCRRSALCPDLVIGKSRYCLKHWCDVIKSKAEKSVGEKIPFSLIDLWNEQRGLCYFTNMPLIPGINASLEHLIPVSKGGNNSKENIRFVLLPINMMKNDLTEKEFLSFLKGVLPSLTKLVEEKGE
jgi:hypothetical protein